LCVHERHTFTIACKLQQTLSKREVKEVRK